MSEGFLLPAAVLAVMAVAVLRWAWSLPQRSSKLNAAGWLALLLALGMGAAAAGAWGLAVTVLAAMAAACLFVGFAAAKAPPPKARPEARRRGGGAMELRQPWHLMRRINSFLLVVGAGLIVSIGLALAARWLLELIGCSEANANVSALFLMPIIWTIVAFTLLMQTGRRRQLTLLLGAIVPGAPFLLTAISG